MAIPQSIGYRNPAKTMTIKALQERQKQAALAMSKATEITQPIADPWQAVSHVLGVAGAKFGEAQAGRQEADARQQLAGIMAGIDPVKGASMQQIAEMQGLDPDLANKIYENMMRTQQENLAREDTQAFQAGESAADRDARIAEQERLFGHQDTSQQADFTHADTTAKTMAETQRVQAEQDAAIADRKAQQDAALRTREGEYDAAVQAGVMTPEERAANIDRDRRAAEADITAKQPETITGVPPEVAAARGGDIAKHPENYQYNTKTQEVEPVAKARTSSDIKTTGDFEKGLIETRSTLTNLDKALELAPQIFEGGGVMGYGDALQRAKAVLLTPSRYDPETVKQAQATQAYFNIMGEQAIKAMGTTLTGATTEFEMQRFIEIMANPATPLATKQAEISRMREKVRAYEQTQRRQVEESGGNVNAGGNLGGGGGGGGGGGNLPKPQTDAEYNALPNGAQYIDPDTGETLTKGAKKK